MSQNQFDQLANRLRQLSLTETPEKDKVEYIMNLTYAELKEYPVDFGKAHLGKKFINLMTDTKYVTWFAETYKHSQKPTHLRFLRFISLHLDQLEKSTDKTRAKLGARSKAMPKNRPAPSMGVLPDNDNFPAVDPITDQWSEAEDFEEEAWSQVPEDNNLELLQMQDRLHQMENVMAQVLDHLSKSEAARSNQSA